MEEERVEVMRKESNVVEMTGRAGLVRTKTEAAAVLPDRGSEGKEQRTYRKRCREFPGRKLRTQGTQIVASAEAKQSIEARQGAAADADVAMYRKYTEALLRRYQRLKLQAGRVPSRMDREMFRGRMSHYKVEGFDDAVIFCTDVERCLQRMNASDERLLRR